MSPNFYYENKIWQKGYRWVAGLDEVGRGALAGPLVCGCVVFIKNKSSFDKKSDIKIDDSKKLTILQRKHASDWIKNNSFWGVGEVSVGEINKKGITKATASGFRRAIAHCNSKLNNRIIYILIDAFYIPYVRGIRQPHKKLKIYKNNRNNLNKIINNGNQIAIINGDEKSISIAAASIIAKVYRDNIMIKLGKKANYKKYSWDSNKGYGTNKHQKAIIKFGITKHHRKLFIRNINLKQ